MSNIDKQALRTDLLMANALETAKQLRELQESPVAEAIFESVVENENGKEIQFERPISDLAFAATWQLEKLAEALESAEKRIAELSRHLQCAHDFIEHTEAFGHEASNGILCCADAQWNIDASKSVLAAAGKGDAA